MHEDRVAAAKAVTELCKQMSEVKLQESAEFTDVLTRLLEITTTKAYFNQKEVLVQNFVEVLTELAPQGAEATTLRTKFLEACLPQVANKAGDLNYKNHLIKSVGVVLNA
jgi:hypothetical protein